MGNSPGWGAEPTRDAERDALQSDKARYKSVTKGVLARYLGSWPRKQSRGPVWLAISQLASVPSPGCGRGRCLGCDTKVNPDVFAFDCDCSRA